MKRQRPKTYETTYRGQKVRVTVPENDSAELFDHIREQLSPEAVAAIVAWLQPAHTNDPQVDRQVRWFADQLVQLLGGNDNFARLMDELGL